MRRILLTKFFSSLFCMLTVGVVLIALSGSMLELGPQARWASLILVSAISLAVCALSTGLGAVFLDLRQRNPSAIVSGFGGTLNLVVSLGFTMAAVMPFTILFHVQAALNMPMAQTDVWMARGIVWLAFITIAVTVVPLWLGVRSLKSRDF